MANDRYRYDRDWYGRDRDRAWRDRDDASGRRDPGYADPRQEDDGYIARRGFGNRSAGFDRDERYAEERSRDYGDSAGYGTGGSARDWRDVVGDDRERGLTGYGVDYGRSREPGLGYGSSYDQDRYGSDVFGRGSRDYAERRGFFERAGDEVRSWFGDDEAERRRDQDMRGADDGHRGRGPRGYQRADGRILEDVSDRLTDDPHIDASEIEVRVSNREVTLDGTVNSRFEKRHAEDIAWSVSGATHVQNNLRIQQAADAGIAGSMLSGSGTSSGGEPTSSAAADANRRQSTTRTGA